MDKKIKSLFEDLGKPTLRGIRKCPKCGTFNGTRGMTCKNKSCNVVFKESKDKPCRPMGRTNLQAVKIVTGSDSQIYSVKVEGGNSDIWGFVQLPLIEGLNLLERTPEVELIVQSAAQCYVDSCQKLNEDIPELALCVNTCRHVSAALSAVREAKPVTLKNSILNSLPISSEMKQELWKLATETSSPLVQRISKNCMVVKCKCDDAHPLGFLHVYFYNRYKREAESKYHVICECENTELTKPKFWKFENRCIHYHACVCAFASDKKLAREFKNFPLIASFKKKAVLQNLCDSSPKRKISILESETSDNEILPKVLLLADVPSPVKKKKENSFAETSSNLILLQEAESDSWTANDPILKSVPDTTSKKTAAIPIDEETVSFSFLSWLATVTERINQTMHFQFNGKPEPLVFHAPQMFFNCLQQRIPCASKKKKLPTSTSTFERKDALPLGKFTKYTWNINNLIHVKQIFDTPETPLQVTQNFVENRDGTYNYYEPASDGEQLVEHYKKTRNNPLIKPLELKTFLKVGNTSIDPEDTSPFVIEWIPNILPHSNIGELHVKFEYGHMRNGRVEVPPESRSILFVQQLPT